MIALIDNNGYENLIGTINEKSGTKGVHNISELNNLVKNMGGGGIPKNAETTMTITTKDDGKGGKYSVYIGCFAKGVTYVLDDNQPSDLAIGYNEIIEIPIDSKSHTIKFSDTYNLRLPTTFVESTIASLDFIDLGCTESNSLCQCDFFGKDVLFNFNEIKFGSKSTVLGIIGKIPSIDLSKQKIDFTNVKRITYDNLSFNNYSTANSSHLVFGNTLTEFYDVSIISIDKQFDTFTIPSSVESFSSLSINYKNDDGKSVIGADVVNIGDVENGSNLRVVSQHFLGESKDTSVTYGIKTLNIYCNSVPDVIDGDAAMTNPYTNVTLYVNADLVNDFRNSAWQRMFPKSGSTDNIVAHNTNA